MSHQRLPGFSLARRLDHAQHNRVPLARADFPAGFTAAQGYAVQAELAELGQLADQRAIGQKTIGRKIGLTSATALAAFGAAEPMVGTITSDSIREAGSHIALEGLIAPRLEGEFLIEIDHLPPADGDDAALIASLVSVRAAFEIADSRIAGWPADVASAIADNACCGLVIPGSERISPENVDFSGAKGILRRDGVIVSEGCASDCLGGVLHAYRWLLARGAAFGLSPRPGDIVMCGAICGPLPMRPGCRYDFALEGLGAVSMTTAGQPD